jgi:hypothetical protein
MPIETQAETVSPITLTGVVVSPQVAQGDNIPPAMLEHCRSLGVEAAVRSLLAWVTKTYPDVQTVELSVFRDEHGQEKIRVSASVTEEGEKEAEQYLACLTGWSGAIEPDAAEKVVFTTL